MIKGKPIHEHDCEGCQFLGNGYYNGRMSDWYRCIRDDSRIEEREMSDTLIARFGPDGDYASTLMWSHPFTDPLFLRALALGYAPDEVEQKIILRRAYAQMNRNASESRDMISRVFIGTEEDVDDEGSLGDADHLHLRKFLK